MFVPQGNMTSWSEMMQEIIKNPGSIYRASGFNLLTNCHSGLKRAKKLGSKSAENITAWWFAPYYFKPPGQKIGTLPMMDSFLRDPKSQEKVQINKFLHFGGYL